MTDKQKIPLAQFDATMSREEMARKLLMALQKAGFKTPPLEKVIETLSRRSDLGHLCLRGIKKITNGNVSRHTKTPKAHKCVPCGLNCVPRNLTSKISDMKKRLTHFIM